MGDQEQSFIAALNLVEGQIRIRSKTSRVLKKDEITYDPDKKITIGGITTHSADDRRPAILIEKDHAQISKIIVKCPCGRCSEIVCEYDELVENEAVETVDMVEIVETNDMEDTVDNIVDE